MKRIGSLAATTSLVLMSTIGFAGSASADEPNYPPSIPPSLATTTAPAVQPVKGVQTTIDPLAETGGGNSTALLAAAVGLVAVGGVTVTYARRRKGAHEA